LKDKRSKILEYEDRYGDIPKDYQERLLWLYDKLQLNDDLSNQIIKSRQLFCQQLEYETINIILYELPEGTPRPRASIVNRKNIINSLKSNSFIHIYSPGQHDNNDYMKMWVQEHLQDKLNQLICTPCWVDIRNFFQTPSLFTKIDTMLAELGCIRYIGKPDADNVAKNYLDSMNHNLWLDDTLVTDLCIHRYYSVLPRTEIDLHYANMLGNKYQYKAIISRKDFTDKMLVTYFGQF